MPPRVDQVGVAQVPPVGLPLVAGGLDDVWVPVCVAEPVVREIAPGMKADIVFLDLGAINWIPHRWSVNQMVHVEDGSSLRHVMIGGRFVVKDRRLLTVDLAKLAREAEAARERLDALGVERRALFEQLAPVVASFCPALAAQPYHIRRYFCDAPA